MSEVSSRVLYPAIFSVSQTSLVGPDAPNDVWYTVHLLSVEDVDMLAGKLSAEDALDATKRKAALQHSIDHAVMLCSNGEFGGEESRRRAVEHLRDVAQKPYIAGATAKDVLPIVMQYTLHIAQPVLKAANADTSYVLKRLPETTLDRL